MEELVSFDEVMVARKVIVELQIKMSNVSLSQCIRKTERWSYLFNSS